MSKRIVVMSVLLTIAMSFAGMVVAADSVTIDTSGATPFLYEGRSYIPLKSVASFLGAPLRWDSAKNQAVITYLGQELALTPNSFNALFGGQPTVLHEAPVIADGRVFVPTEALRRFYNVPVEWDGATKEVKINGESGWGTMKVEGRPPWHGGPPPWAPAWGKRAQGASGNYEPGAPRHDGDVSPSQHEQDRGKQKKQ